MRCIQCTDSCELLIAPQILALHQLRSVWSLDGQDSTFVHGAPSADISNFHRFTGHGVVVQNGKVGQLTGNNTAEFILHLQRISSLDRPQINIGRVRLTVSSSALVSLPKNASWYPQESKGSAGSRRRDSASASRRRKSGLVLTAGTVPVGRTHSSIDRTSEASVNAERTG